MTSVARRLKHVTLSCHCIKRRCCKRTAEKASRRSRAACRSGHDAVLPRLRNDRPGSAPSLALFSSFSSPSCSSLSLRLWFHPCFDLPVAFFHGPFFYISASSLHAPSILPHICTGSITRLSSPPSSSYFLPAHPLWPYLPGITVAAPSPTLSDPCSRAGYRKTKRTSGIRARSRIILLSRSSTLAH